MGLWFIWWDACGLFCFLFGEAVVWFSNYVVVFLVLEPWFKWNALGLAHLAVFEAIILVVEVAHWRAMFTNPGVTQPNTATLADVEPDTSDALWWTKPKRRFCKKCNALKPPRAHHCSVAGRCVVKMDHYCPWVNNTVGQNNHKFFLQFLVYVSIGTAYASLMTATYAFQAWRGAVPWPAWGMTQMIMAVFQVVLDVFFTIFVIAMMCDQYEAVCTDTTGIEAMKRWEERDWTIWEGLASVMGTPFGWRWFIPVLPSGTGYYEWSPTEDPDAYDIRDPAIKAFFRDLELERRLAELKGEAAPGAEEAEAPAGDAAGDAGGKGGKKGGGKKGKGKKKGGSGVPRAKPALVRVYDAKGEPQMVPRAEAARMAAAAPADGVKLDAIGI